MDHEGMDFDSWWQQQGGWYVERDIDKETFHFFPFRNGFKMGDIMILRGIEPKDIKIGDVLVYESSTHRNPIIHRVVEMNLEEGAWTFRTKGDHNTGADYEVIHENQIERTGKAILRLPYLGWVKIWFVRLVGLE
jgi:signal peptidase I